MADAGLKAVLRLKGQSSIMMVGLGHCGVHWVFAVFYILQPYIKRDLGISYTELGILHAVFHFSSFAANIGSGFLDLLRVETVTPHRAESAGLRYGGDQ